MNSPARPLLRTPLTCLGGLCALVGAAQAQDPFSPYGMDGRGIEDLRGGTRLSTTGLATPRLGFKSSQDAAMRPGFALQTGLSLDDGSLGGGFFPARVHDPMQVESPSVGGFRLGVQSGFGEVVQGFGGNQVQDTYARFSQGRFDIAAGMVEDRGGLMTPQLNQRGWVVGAAYSVGALRLHGAYQTLEDRAGASNIGGSGWWVGADYRLGSNLVRVQYVVNQPRNLDNARSDGLGVSYEYSLSRSTTLYSGLSYFRYQDNAGLARGALSMPGAQTHGNDNDMTQWRGGMRFSF